MPSSRRTPRVPDLKSLAKRHFRDSPLTTIENKLLLSVATGDFLQCGPNSDRSNPENHPQKAEGWDENRQIRPALIRWLCVDPQARQLVDPRGIRIHGAMIKDTLDLSYATVPFGLTLWNCRLAAPANLQDLEIAELDLDATWTAAIGAGRIKLKGSLLMQNGFRAAGEVRLVGAQISGNLECDGGTFLNPLPKKVEPSGVPPGTDAGAPAAPPQENPESLGIALAADSAVISGDVFLRKGFHADGQVRLLGTQIGGDLDCTDASFKGELSVQRAVIRGAISWARIVDPGETTLDFANASAGSLFDDAKSWPVQGQLDLDGFVYGRIFDAPKDPVSRLEWLDRQRPSSRQPYRQLAKVLREEGEDAGARRVISCMERRLREQERPNYFARFWSGVLRWTVGYGHHPGRSILWLLGLMAVGFPLYWCGYARGGMSPTEKEAYYSYQANRYPPAYYPRFHASAYSFENSFPLGKLGQVEPWAPNPSPAVSVHGSYASRVGRWFVSARFLRWFAWAQILLGWFFATMGVAAVSGIVRKDKD
jgi:hypothetical protein